MYHIDRFCSHDRQTINQVTPPVLATMLEAGVITYIEECNEPLCSQGKWGPKTGSPVLRAERSHHQIELPNEKSGTHSKQPDATKIQGILVGRCFEWILRCQFCYLRIAQGLCRAPHTFAQLKDYVGGPIPLPNAEPAIFGITESDSGASAYESFVDDDSGSNASLEIKARFLHESYFPGIKWADLVGSVIWLSLLNYVLMFRWKLFVDWFWICSGFRFNQFVCIWTMKRGMKKRGKEASRVTLRFKGMAVVQRCSGALP